MPPGFIHLRLHSEYSLSDSVVRIPELVAAVAAAGMPAVAVTDRSNLFAMVKFYREALQRGVKPIVGVDLAVREEGERREPSRLTLLCQTQDGYRNLARLLTRAYLEGRERGLPRIERAWLSSENVSGLIALSGALEGDVGRALVNGREADAERALEEWRALFPNRYYLELQRLGRQFEESYIAGAVSLAARHALPVVATNDVRFLKAEEFESHEARVCIHDGALLADPARARRYTRQQYLRSPAEMSALFADFPEALENSVEIARRCSLTLSLGEARLPQYPVPAGISIEDYLRAEALRGLRARFGSDPPGAYHERLSSELGVICQMGFAGYFLIVADFIRWARDNGVPVGPGRGSGAGSLVAYSLGVTDLDPLKHDLLFERFLNPERVSMPDFDIDFCMEGRDRVIEYVAAKYGRERVSQIITYGTMAAKAVVRDVGRVLGMPYGYVDRIAKLIPFELGITLDDALEKEPELKRLYQAEEEVKNLIDLARSLEGLTRNAGMHAGGVVIAPSVLTDFAPLYCDAAGGSVVTQFDKDDVEAAGLVKFDFLGLRTLTVIDRAVRIINAAAAPGSALLQIGTLPMDDAPTYALLKSCRTTAVFQLESRGMKDLIRRLQPDCFEDIVALVALFRPGPLQSGMVDDFISRKHGRSDAPIDYLHPSLAPVLKPTYGVILYQEQVMQIAQSLAGYTLGGADLLRRAMGKKKPEEMAQQRSVFIGGAVARGVRQGQAEHIFDLMEKFAGYGFNKSHSAAYALLAYQTAYLKAHHPAAFMAAVLSADMDHTDKVVTLIKECSDMELAVLPPDVNASSYEFSPDGARCIRYGLGAVRGVGAGAVEGLIEERTARGPYQSLEDLCRRLDLQRVNRRVLEALLRSGSLDSLGENRATLMDRLLTAMQLGDQNTRAHAAGQNDMFGGLGAVERAAPASRRAALPEWSEAVRLAGERDTLGLYLTGHPLTRFEGSLARLVSHRIGDLVGDRPTAGFEPGRGASKPVTVAGLIDEVKKRGPRVILTLDDRTGRLEVMLFEETWAKHRDLISKDALVLVEGLLRFDEFSDSWRLAARRVCELERLREQEARRVVLRCSHAELPRVSERLAGILQPWRGGPCPITIEYTGAAAHGALNLGNEWSVRASRELLEQLEGLVGSGAVQVVYGAPPASAGGAYSADGR
ncbi:MAG TPA: DNA polymerase III subunit alpha [Steroidobacteraceae bacterium]|jgi:DNA polymerase-3 subunit alpha|nr:DNA polymerase III subunit alpha [Steroidobacteraceae bacterium]